MTLLEYGDLECPYCGQAEPVIRELLAEVGNLRYVWRHLPLNDVHPQAQLAAEATEAAALQGRFWDMHDRLIAHQDELKVRQIVAHAEALGLDMERVQARRCTSARARATSPRTSSRPISAVCRGRRSFFINGHRHQGAYDIDTLTKAVKLARARVGPAVLSGSRPRARRVVSSRRQSVTENFVNSSIRSSLRAPIVSDMKRAIGVVAATAVCALGAAASASAATDVQQAQSENWSGYVSGAGGQGTTVQGRVG